MSTVSITLGKHTSLKLRTQIALPGFVAGAPPELRSILDGTVVGGWSPPTGDSFTSSWVCVKIQPSFAQPVRAAASQRLQPWHTGRILLARDVRGVDMRAGTSSLDSSGI